MENEVGRKPPVDERHIRNERQEERDRKDK